MLFRSLLTIASSLESTMAASRSASRSNALAAGEIARDLRRADDLARAEIGSARPSARSGSASVLALPHRLEVIDGIAAPHAGEHAIFFLLPIGGHDHADRPADDFGRGVAEQPFGRPVPRDDRAIQILADDRVVARFDDGGEMVARRVRAAAAR